MWTGSCCKGPASQVLLVVGDRMDLPLWVPTLWGSPCQHATQPYRVCPRALS